MPSWHKIAGVSNISELFSTSGGEPCTKDTTLGTGPWLGTGQNFTVRVFLVVLIEVSDQVLLKVVDTPGFGDSDGADNELIEEMMDVLDNTLGYTNIILLVIEGGTPRFDDPLRAMLRQMTSIFGESWWDFTMIGEILRR